MQSRAAVDAGRRVNDWRKGSILLLSAFVLVAMFGFVAFTIDYGYMSMTQVQLQNAADGAALAGANELSFGTSKVQQTAKDVAAANKVGSQSVVLENADIELGYFDLATLKFTAGAANANATRVVARVTDRPLFFAPVIGHKNFSIEADATAMINPRDIVFAVDLSGSMNDDTEPCWATEVITDQFSGSTGPNKTVANDMMVTMFADLNFGSFPGTLEGIGENVGIANNNKNYAELTDDFGPLTDSSLSDHYRIKTNDSETNRKKKAYRWIIDKQLARLMPNARPVPDSTNTDSFNYYEKYLDYIIDSTNVGVNPPKPKPKPKPGPKPKPSPKPKPKPSPPAGNILPTVGDEVIAGDVVGNVSSEDVFGSGSYPVGTPRNGKTTRIRLPPHQDGDRIDDFNNPNKSTFPGTSVNTPKAWRNQLGYRTYTQFMLDWGRERSPTWPNGANADVKKPLKVQMSVLSPDCPMHNEVVNGQTFSFPPRTQPMHATRRSLIRAIQLVKQRNTGVGAAAADRVAIVTYDGKDAFHSPELVVSLTTNYDAAMTACTTLQATGDIGYTTATENGIIMARNELEDAPTGNGRSYASKVLILLTDGVPNAWESNTNKVNNYVQDALDNGEGADFYAKDYPWYNAALMQASQLGGTNDLMFGVGMGLGADFDFMDRLSRFAGTDKAGQGPRTSGQPSAYETELTAILSEIIETAGTRLVE